MPRIQPGPPCTVCGKPSTARNLCETHYSRWKRHGDVGQTRPEDWGKRFKHPLNECWHGTRRVAAGRVPRWNDFWAFVEDVGERPSPDHTLKRSDHKKPFGPENCYWREPLGISVQALANNSEYQRQWRIKNPRRAKNSTLKKYYGIGINEYETMLEAQNYKCAICGGSDEWFSLAVDHCHGTKGIRGLLCSQCNRGIGLFKDNPDALGAAAAYIRRFMCVIEETTPHMPASEKAPGAFASVAAGNTG